MSSPSVKVSELLHSMQACIINEKAWSTTNIPKYSDNNTELMLVTSNRSKHLHNLPTSITIGNAKMNEHVSNITRTCYFYLRRLTSIRRFLTSTAIATLVTAFVLSRIDYCSSLLFGSTFDVTIRLNVHRTMVLE